MCFLGLLRLICSIDMLPDSSWVACSWWFGSLGGRCGSRRVSRSVGVVLVYLVNVLLVEWPVYVVRPLGTSSSLSCSLLPDLLYLGLYMSYSRGWDWCGFFLAGGHWSLVMGGLASGGWVDQWGWGASLVLVVHVHGSDIGMYCKVFSGFLSFRSFSFLLKVGHSLLHLAWPSTWQDTQILSSGVGQSLVLWPFVKFPHLLVSTWHSLAKLRV